MRGRQNTPSDWRSAAEVLAEAAVGENISDLVDRILPRLQRLFQADLVIWDQFDGKMRQEAWRMMPPANERIVALQPAFVAHCHQHPFVPDWIEFIASGRVGVLSDRIATRDFLRTDLWREVYSHLHGKHQLLFGGRIDVDNYWSIACNRLRRDYDSRDRELARFLQPPLNVIFRRLARRGEALRAADLLKGILSHREAAYLIVEANGRVLEISDEAHALSRAAGETAWSAEQLKELLGHDRVGSDAIGLTQRRWAGLRATVIRGAAVGPALILLARAQTNARIKSAHRLTKREEEIFHWIGEGKNNREIGVLLGISSRTVEKHCERLFEKIGVENRLGAALAAGRQALK